MKRSIVSKGKTVKEAIQNGLLELNTTEEQVKIRIIEEGKKGLLGIGSEPAVVKLIKVDSNIIKLLQDEDSIVDVSEQSKVNLGDSKKLQNKQEAVTKINAEQVEKILSVREETLQPDEEEEEFSVWIENGEVKFITTPNYHPKITTIPEVSLFINGKFVERTAELKEDDVVKIEIDQEIVGLQKTIWEIQIDDDYMVATLKVSPGMKKIHTLNDANPSKHVKLSLSEVKTPYDILEPSAVTQKLKEMGVVFGIKHDVIDKACQSTVDGEFIVAEGIFPKDGEDGFIELMPNISHSKSYLKHDKDYVDLDQVNSVMSGQSIGIIHPPKNNGTIGKRINGEEVTPLLGKALIVRANNGAAYVQQEKKLVALQPGRPKFQKGSNILKVSVVPQIIHTSDVSYRSGNLDSKGDIIIQGNVKESMKVEATENIVVNGTVEVATLTAGNAITIRRDVWGSKLTVGGNNKNLGIFTSILHSIVDQLEKLIVAVEQFKKSAQTHSPDFSTDQFKSLILILLEKKFPTLLPMIKQFINEIRIRKGNDLLDEDWISFTNRISMAFISLDSAVLGSLDDIVKMKKLAEDLHKISMITFETFPRITLPYSKNTHIDCVGDVIVVGQGCYNTYIHALGIVKINGYFRGGELYAKKGVEISESGVLEGIPTRITVDSGQTIRINAVIGETTITVGKNTHTFSYPASNVCARLDEKGKLVLF